MPRKAVTKQKQKQKQSQNVRVIVNLAEKPKRKRRAPRKKPVEETLIEPQLFRQLPPQIYIPPPQVTHYMMPPEELASKPSITSMATITNPRATTEAKTMSFGDTNWVIEEPHRPSRYDKVDTHEPLTAEEKKKFEPPIKAPPMFEPLIEATPSISTPSIIQIPTKKREMAILQKPEEKSIPSILGDNPRSYTIELKKPKYGEKQAYIPQGQKEYEIPEQFRIKTPKPAKQSMSKMSKSTLQNLYKTEIGTDPNPKSTIAQLKQSIKTHREEVF